MAKGDITVEKFGDVYKLNRPQWGDNSAYISANDELLEEVLKHTWTYSSGPHPYLRTNITCANSQPHSISLHRFVLNYMYGEERITEMLGHDNIIEHLDNNGLNCAYTNLHILSEDLNKAKAFTVDKEQGKTFTGVPPFIADAYFAYKYGYFQMQITFNNDILGFKDNGKLVQVESITILYEKFWNLYIDWLHIIEFKNTNTFDVNKLNLEKVKVKPRPQVELTEEEKKGFVIQRNGETYFILHTDGSDGLLFIRKTAYRDLGKM